MSRLVPRSRDGARPPPSNGLLLRLSASTLARLSSQLEPVALASRQVLHRVDEHMRFVYFVESGLCSLMTVTRDGQGVEATAIGREGLVGLAVGLGGPSMPVETIVQVSGSALRMSADAFRRERLRDEALRDLVDLYAHTLLVHLLQSAACNRLHDLQERCCRWLLGAHDRLSRSSFPVTQELLAAALGVRRPSLSLAMRTLQHAGLISYRRGQITIQNRKGIEKASCECYAVVRRHVEKVLAPTPRP